MQPPKPDYGAGSVYHERRRGFQASAIRCLEATVQQWGMPDSLLDVGCGAEGVLVHWAHAHNLPASGIDIGIPPFTNELGLWQHDLRQPLHIGRSFHWVLCWEVAEHVEAEFADILCDSIVRHLARPSGRLLFTAAAPGQRGPGHVNCQPAAYWRGLFEARGLAYLSGESLNLGQLWRSTALRAPWYGKNLQVFGWA